MVRLDRSIDIDSWAENLPLEAIAALQDLLAQCREIGPPAGAWLVELEEGYRYPLLAGRGRARQLTTAVTTAAGTARPKLPAS
jgi:hypothetical protein